MPNARVSTVDTASSNRLSSHIESDLVPADRDSQLALSTLALQPGATVDVGDDLADTLLYCFAGSGADGLVEGSALLVVAGERTQVRACDEGLQAVRGTIGPAVDLHAPMGPRAVVERLSSTEEAAATGSRSFQVLFDARNGSTRATLFVGQIPPGKAPWHYHLYDEIVWIVAGEGRLHLGQTVERLAPGSAFRLRPREVHIVENTADTAPLSVLGLFTPAGSPSAAYLEPDVHAQYVIG